MKNTVIKTNGYNQNQGYNVCMSMITSENKVAEIKKKTTNLAHKF